MHTNTTHTAHNEPCVPNHYPHRAPDIMSVLRLSTSSASSLFHILVAEIQNLPHQSHHPIRNIPPRNIDANHPRKVANACKKERIVFQPPFV